MELPISIKAEEVFRVGDFAVTNSILLSGLALIFTIGFMLFVGRKMRQLKKMPAIEAAKKRQGFFTRLAIWAFEGLYKTVQSVVPSKKIAKMVAPFSITIFFFVIFNYYFGILPFVGEVIHAAVHGHAVPLFRAGTADLNLTFMLAILTIVMVQIYAVKALGVKGNLRRYFVNPFRDPIGSFGGILELIGEFSRMLALAMRLFGNCFAGEILLLVVAVLANFASPLLLPFFYLFELFIGGIQAYIFFMLASVFSGIAVGHAAHEPKSSNHSIEAKPMNES